MSMNTADFEKVATQLAACAVKKDTAALGHVKQAAGVMDSLGQVFNSPTGRYVVGGLGGAGLGALVGAMQPKNKKRNALYYGALGGLGGAGLAHLINNAGAGQSDKKQTPAGTSSAADASAQKQRLPDGPINVDAVLTPETATLPRLLDQRGGSGEHAHVPVKPRYVPTDEQKEWKSRQDIGPSYNNETAFTTDLNEQYQNWRRNPDSVGWLTRWRFGRQFEERAAREQAQRMQLPPPAIPVREDGTPTGHVVPDNSTPTSREHDIYSEFQIPNPNGGASGKYRPGALELIRQARRYGFGQSADRVKEFQRGLANGYSPWFVRFMDQVAEPTDSAYATYGDPR